MKLNVNFGELLHGVHNLPVEVPVLKNFDTTKLQGLAYVTVENGKVTADLNISDPDGKVERLKDTLECGVAGRVISRKGNLITEFDLISVSIQVREDLKSKSKKIE